MTYSLNEILDIAIGIEDSGIEFYTTCADRFKNDSMKEIFLFLAKEEINHKHTFEKIRENAAKESGNFTEDYYLYLKAIGGGHIFKNKISVTDIIKNMKSPAEAVNKAFQDEKESILFYLGLKDMVPPKYGKDKVEQIIREERKHVIQLSAYRKKLS